MSPPTLAYGKKRATLRTPYDAAFVTALKARIPHTQRSWSQDRSVWTVDLCAVAVARDVMLEAWPEILVTGDGGEDYLLDRFGTMTSQPSLFG